MWTLKAATITECAAQIVAEMTSIRDNATVAFRGGERFVETLDPLNLSAAPERRRLQPRGVYLITGGLGGIGLVVAEHLAREFNARLVLVTRSTLPLEATLGSRSERLPPDRCQQTEDSKAA